MATTITMECSGAFPTATIEGSKFRCPLIESLMAAICVRVKGLLYRLSESC
jgi:hypothetical protein